MADTPINPQNTPGPQEPAAPASRPLVEKLLASGQKFLKSVFSFLSITTIALIGFAIVVLTWITVFTKKAFFKIPDMSGPLTASITSWPFLLTGIGLLFIARSRALTRNAYEAAAKKSPQFPHTWKISLIGTQSFFLYLLAFYAIGVGLRFWPKMENVVLLLLLFLFFLAYLLWYVVSHFQNRSPEYSGLKIAALALALAFLAAISMNFFILVGLILAFFSLIMVLVSISSVPFSAPEGRVWIRAICLLGTIALLVPSAYNFFFNNESQCNLIELDSAVKGIAGEVYALGYSPDGKKLAFSVKTDQWYLELFTPNDRKNPMIKYPAGDDAFTPVFVENGKYILSDISSNGARNLRLTNLSTSAQQTLTENGVVQTGDGSLWSEDLGEFLFMAEKDGQNAILTVSPLKKKFKTILQSDDSIASPSWIHGSKTIAYISGTGASSTIQVYSLATKKSQELHLLGADHDEAINPADLPPHKFSLLKVIPAPDGFRFLFVRQDGKLTSLWTVHPDGSKEAKLYETSDSIGKIAWTPDAQKILFEQNEKIFGKTTGFTHVKLLDANLDTVQNLILPQIATRDPAPTPNGANVAFVCPENLWYPSINRLGIWIGTLR